jgi:glycosyltransferase involved in cell wall biosynthesis
VPLTGSELVSAVIPTRNRSELVVKAVQSALHQTHPPIEVIVVIDGPDPPTESALAKIHDTRVRIFLLAANVGGAEARNIGVRAARAASGSHSWTTTTSGSRRKFPCSWR